MAVERWVARVAGADVKKDKQTFNFIINNV